MLERKLKNKLTDEKGSGLVLALMVLLVLSVLGASLGVVTIGSLQLSTVNRDTNSAYYIAEAGANMAYDDFMKIVKQSYDQPTGNTSTGFYDAINLNIADDKGNRSYSKKFEPQAGVQPKANVTIAKSPEPEKTYLIESTGEIDGETRTVEKEVLVKWKSKNNGGSFGFPENAVAIGREEVEAEGGTIKGDIYIGKTKKVEIEVENEDGYKGKIDGSIYIDDIEETVEIEVENDGIITGNIYINNIRNQKNKDKVIEIEVENKGIIKGNIYISNIQNTKDSKIKIKVEDKDSIEGNIYIDNKDINVTYEGIDKNKIKYGEKNVHIPNKGWENSFGNVEKYVEGIESKSNKQKLSIDKTDAEEGWKEIDLTDYACYETDKENISNENLKFKIGNNDVYLFMDNLKEIVGSKIDIIGEGTLTIVLSYEKDVEIKKSTINKSENNLRIVYLTKDKELEIKDGSVVYGQIIALKSEVEIKDSGSKVVGNIIADEVEIEKGGTLDYREYSFNDSDYENIETNIDVTELVFPEPIIEINH